MMLVLSLRCFPDGSSNVVSLNIPTEDMLDSSRALRYRRNPYNQQHNAIV